MESKERISKALMELMRDQNLREIQINEIAYRCRLSRRTIQRHFNGKRDILRYQLKKMVDSFQSQNQEDIETIVDFFGYLYGMKETIFLLKNRGGLELLSDIIKERVVNEIKEYFLKEESPIGETEKEYLVNMTSYQIVAIFDTWVEHHFEDDMKSVKSIIRSSLVAYEKYL